MANTKKSHAHRSAFRVAVLPLALIAALALSACSETEDSSEFNGTITLTVENPDRCDPLDQRHCLLPFPSDTFTVAGDATDTGLHVSFALASMPVNATNVYVDPTEWNRNDGFSPGAQIATFVAGIDLAQSRIPAVTDIGASLAADAGSPRGGCPGSSDFPARRKWKTENRKQEIQSRFLPPNPCAGFPFPVSGFLCFIFLGRPRHP